MVNLIEDLAGDLHHLDQRIDEVTGEIETLADNDEACQRLMTVPGIGPIIASAMVATIGDGSVFHRGRDFGAWLGLVPRQTSTGDRTILGRISKRGNSYLRMLFVQAARVVLLRPPTGPSTASAAGWRLPPSACITTSSPQHSPTSSPALPGVCCITGAAMSLGCVLSSPENRRPLNAHNRLAESCPRCGIGQRELKAA